MKPIRLTEPLIVQASLDPDAVKILRRLLRYGHEAYLVGGCVRDLSLGRIPKDFDIATSARPRQVKRLFRNSRIIGRRFKLVHIQFGDKLIEVSTFRRTPRDESFEQDRVSARRDGARRDDDDERDEVGPERHPRAEGKDRDWDQGDGDGDSDDLLIRRDNVFGSAEEDALRRDFTINALFYDLDENEVIDYIGGAEDLDRREIRTIGDPRIRFQEDPVRILRAIRFAARLDFDIDPETYDAMVETSGDLVKCAAPRVTEELQRLLSCGDAGRALDLLDRTGALDAVLPEVAEFLDRNPLIGDWEDHVYDLMIRYFDAMDDFDHGRRIVSNPTLLTVLLVGPIRERLAQEGADSDPAKVADQIVRPFASRMSISRRDAFRIKQILVAQPRLLDQRTNRSRRRRTRPADLVRREYFKDALDFFRIESMALKKNQDEADRWTDLYYDHLRRNDPEGYRLASLEAPFGLPRSERSDAEDEGFHERKSDRGASRPHQEEAHADGEAPPRKKRKRSRRGKKSAAAASDRDRDEQEKPSDRQANDSAEARGRRRSPSKGGRKTTTGRSGEERRSRSGKKAAAQKGSGGQRLEFDEIRAGPLRSGEVSQEEIEEEEALADVQWNDPLPTVGDPGPISVIRTGIDQTERRGGRRKKKKPDAASRELSKEVRDQPALQAFKMMGGDPRGHQPTRPRKLRRSEREQPARPAEQEQPFDPVADFEWIESLYNW